MKSEKREKSKVAGVTQRKDGRWVFKYRDENRIQHMDNHFGKGSDAKKAAEARALQFQADKKLGKKPEVRSKAIYFEDLAQLYINERRNKVSASYLFDLTHMLNEHGILKVLNQKPIDKLEYADITKAIRDEYEKKLHRSLSTQQRYLGYIRAIFRFNLKCGLTKKTKINPLEGMELAAEPGRDSQLTFEDFLNILDAAPEHLRWALTVQWYTDTRPGVSELYALKWSNFDFKEHKATIKLPKTSKNGKREKFVPLKPEFEAMLLEKKAQSTSEYVITYKGQPIKRLKRAFKTASRNAGIKYSVCQYDIRHLFTTVIRQAGAPDKPTADLAGHGEDVMKKIYTGTVAGALEAAMALLPSIIGGKEPILSEQLFNYQI